MILRELLELRLSGGISNNNPLLSIGGAISENLVAGNLFDSGALSFSEDYRCVYVINTGVEDIPKLRMYLSPIRVPRETDQVLVGTTLNSLNTEAESLPSRFDMPSGVEFIKANSSIKHFNIGTLAPGDYMPIWLKRIINPNIGSHRLTYRIVFVSIP